MTAENIIDKAVELLGYNDINGTTAAARYQTAALTAVNTVYSDLYYLSNEKGFNSVDLYGEINLSERILNDVMPFGVAALIAQSMGDSDNQSFYSQMYNLKRKSAVAHSEIQDVLPTLSEDE